MYHSPIEAYAKQLKLPYLKKNYSTLLQQAIDLDQSFEEFLTQLLTLEIEQRQNNRIQTLIRQSKLPSKVTFDDYMDSHLEVKMKKQIKELKTLRFIDQKEGLQYFV